MDWIHEKIIELIVAITAVLGGWNIYLTKKNSDLESSIADNDKALAAHEAGAKVRDDATMDMIQMAYDQIISTGKEVKELRQESQTERRAMSDQIGNRPGIDHRPLVKQEIAARGYSAILGPSTHQLFEDYLQ